MSRPCFNGAALNRVRKAPVIPITNEELAQSFNGAALNRVRKGSLMRCRPSKTDCYNGAALNRVRKAGRSREAEA